MKQDLVRFFRVISNNKLALLSLVTLFFWTLIAIAAVLHLTPSPLHADLERRLQAPTWDSFFGFDSNGIHLGALLAEGARTTLAVSLGTVAASLLIGVPLGGLAGYHGGKIDMVISRITDIVLSFPPLLLPIAVAAFFGGGLVHVVLALSLSGWVAYARVVRAQILSLREREFIVASKALGAGEIRILTRHLFPLLLSPLAVQATFALAGAVLAEAGLSFLGLGVGGNTTSWGSILSDGRHYLLEAPHIIFIPGLALFSIVASLNFIGEALRVTFDPKAQLL